MGIRSDGNEKKKSSSPTATIIVIMCVCVSWGPGARLNHENVSSSNCLIRRSRGALLVYNIKYSGINYKLAQPVHNLHVHYGVPGAH